jgi:hypothetical protein
VRDNIPRQRLSRSQKTDSWAKQVIDELEKISYTDNYNGRSGRYKKQINYDLYNGKLNEEDFEYVVNPYGFKEHEFPANLQHYDIMSPKINLLLGEEIKRPFNFKVVSRNPEAISEREEKEKEMMMTLLKAKIAAAVTGDEDIQEEAKKTPQEIQRYIRYSYQDTRQKIGQQSLEYLQDKLSTKHLFSEGFKHALISGEEIYWVGIVNGEPHMRVCNPLDITVLLDPDSWFIEDAQAIIEERWLTIGTIIDEFDLDAKQIDKLEATHGGRTRTYMEGGGVNYPHSSFFIQGEEAYYNDTAYKRSRDGDGTVRVLRCEWKSMRKLGFFTTTLEDGKEDSNYVDELFSIPDHATKSKGIYTWEDEFGVSTLEWTWVNEYWEGTKIGDDLYVDIQPKPNQRRDMDNPSKCKSGYTGYIYNAMNSESVSLVDRMKPYQYLYDIIYYRLELALAKSKGRVAVMDIAQVPASEGWNVDKWMYYLDALGVMFINSKEEGKRGDTSQFNQFQAIDLTLGNQIQQHVALLSQIEDKLGELSGVSRQRQGQIQSRELVGNVERAVTQSSHITEYWFTYHNEVKERVLEGIMDIARIAWRKGKKVQYVLDDMAQVFFTVDGIQFANSEYGIFVSDADKDSKNLESLRSLSQIALQADKVNLSEVAMMLNTESIVDIQKRLEEAEERRAQQIQQAEEAKAQAAEKQLQMIQEAEREKQDREDNRHIMDNNTKLEIALINAEAKDQANLDKNKNNVPDDIEQQKLQLQREKMTKDSQLKQQQINDAREKAAKELQLKEKQINKKPSAN